MVYQWKPNSRIRADADMAGQICERLEAEGRLTPRDLLDESRAEDAPLHNEFTWDDGEAAEKWRTEEARHIISCLTIVSVKNEPVRQFLTITSTDKKYHSREVLLRQEETRAMLLAQAKKELAAFKTKYRQLTELAKIFEAIEELG